MYLYKYFESLSRVIKAVPPEYKVYEKTLKDLNIDFMLHHKMKINEILSYMKAIIVQIYDKKDDKDCSDKLAL